MMYFNEASQGCGVRQHQHMVVFWIDTPGAQTRKRRVVSLGVCHSRSVVRRKLRKLIELEGSNTREYSMG